MRWICRADSAAHEHHDAHGCIHLRVIEMRTRVRHTAVVFLALKPWLPAPNVVSNLNQHSCWGKRSDGQRAKWRRQTHVQKYICSGSANCPILLALSAKIRQTLCIFSMHFPAPGDRRSTQPHHLSKRSFNFYVSCHLTCASASHSARRITYKNSCEKPLTGKNGCAIMMTLIFLFLLDCRRNPLSTGMVESAARTQVMSQKW